MSKSVTMKDIATELGISTVSVSKALTDKDGVSEEVRQKIKDKAREMGYRYRPVTRNASEGNSGNVGIVVSNRYFEDNSFYNKLYRLIILELNQTSYSSVFEIVSDEQEIQCVLPNMITNDKIDGLIVMGQMSEAYLQNVKNAGIPMLMLDFYNSDSEIESITSDNVFGSYQLTNYLIQMGHRDMYFIGSREATSSIMDRYLGFCKGLIQHGIAPQEDRVIPDRDEKGRFVEIVLPKQMPTAFVCNCDQVAYRLTQRLRAEGYRVPEDISVVGFDDYLYATLGEPQLTTFQVDIRAMAYAAVTSILKRMKKGNKATSRKVIAGKIVIRDSVAPVKKNK